jgi:hypothetical protein
MAALATAKETPKMAFAPKFDLFEYHLNQSSSDQFDFAQKTETPTSSSAIIVFTFFTAFKTPFPRYAFPPSRILQLHARLLMRPKVLQLFLKLHYL